MNAKADEYEYQVIDFIQGILAIAGIEDNPTFTRSYLINQSEEIQNLVAAGEYLPADYVTTKILNILGDADKAEDILNQMSADEVSRGFQAGDVVE